MKFLAPSILSADLRVLGEEIEKVVGAGAEYIHYDVMDGIFVPNFAFGIPELKASRKATDKCLDVHLMILRPKEYLKAFYDAGADIVTFHMEAESSVKETIEEFKKLKASFEKQIKIGLVLNPGTPVDAVRPYLNEIDQVLLMGVQPGFGGQSFIPEVYEKISVLRDLLDREGLPVMLEVDGGVNMENAGEIAKRGTDLIVAGTAVYSGNCVDNTKKLIEIINN